MLAASRLEYWCTRLVMPDQSVVHCGIGAPEWRPSSQRPAILVGLAGALGHDLPSGSVIIPSTVVDENGREFECDQDLVSRMTVAATLLGWLPHHGAMLTSRSMVSGDRSHFFGGPCVAVDMEAATVAGAIERFASVRVVLDTPSRPISNHWLQPSRAVRQPRLWSELLWLLWAAPQYAVRAARVVDMGLRVPDLRRGR